MSNNQRPLIYGLGITFSIVATVSVVLRFQARRIKRLPFEADDWTILIALILSIGTTIDILLMSRLGGLGTHSHYINGEPGDPIAVLNYRKTAYALYVLTWPTVGMNKISVLLLYKRLFYTGVSASFRNLIWMLIGVIVAWTVALTLGFLFSCLPIASQWEFNVDSRCVHEQAFCTIALATDAAIDCLILLLAVYQVWKLQMPMSQKLIVIFIFLLGGLVSIIGFIRIHFLTLAYNALNDPAGTDTTWLESQVYYWTFIETNVGVLSVCLPTLGPIKERFKERLKELYSPKSPVSKALASLTKLFSLGRKVGDVRPGSIEDGSHPEISQQPHDETEQSLRVR